MIQGARILLTIPDDIEQKFAYSFILYVVLESYCFVILYKINVGFAGKDVEIGDTYRGLKTSEISFHDIEN